MTKKLHYIVITTLLLTLVLSSCKDDDKPAPETGATSCLLTKITDRTDYDTTITTFTYQADGKLSAINNPWLDADITVNYANGRISEMVTGSTQIIMKYEPGMSLPLRCTIVDGGDTASEISFIPGKNGLSRLEYRYMDDKTSTLVLETEILLDYNSSGAIRKCTYSSLDNNGILQKNYECTNITTDGKLNPIGLDPAIFIFYAIDEDMLLLGSDNVLSATYSDFYTSNPDVREYDATISYNELSYPTEISSSTFGRLIKAFEYSCR
jgi:YD repeat-containing protein